MIDDFCPAQHKAVLKTPMKTVPGYNTPTKTVLGQNTPTKTVLR